MKKLSFTFIVRTMALWLILFACISCTAAGIPVPVPAEEVPEPTTPASVSLSPVINKLGETGYDIQCQVIIKNEGPGVISRLLIRVALPSNRENLQTVKLDQSESVPGKKERDSNGNVFTEIELSNIEPGREIPVSFSHRVVVNDVQFASDNCKGDTIGGFLQPEKWTESDNPEIAARARQITAGKSTPCTKARAIYDWIGDNIKYSGFYGADRGALYCLQNGSGDCSEFSYLTIAMCRAVGIPARFVEGFTYQKGKTAISDFKHDWAEIYLAGIGWVPVDATWGRSKVNRDKYFARMPSDHIIITVGNPQSLARLSPPFHYFEYRYWWLGKSARPSVIQNLSIVPVIR